MEMSQETVVESTEINSPEVEPSTEVQVSTSDSDDIRSQIEKIASKSKEIVKEQVKEPEWSPNFKVKAYDNEYEIPEKFRSYINKDNEADFRDVFEKAYAIDVMKEKLQKTRQENETFKETSERFNTLRQNLQKVSKYVENGDFDMFFETLKIPESNIQKWLLSKLQQKELPPEQQAIYNKSIEERRKLYELEQQNESLRSQFEQFQESQKSQLVQQTFAQLDGEIAKPEVTAIASQFDASVGKAGAFRQEVLNRAAFVYRTTGKDMTPSEAVQETLRVLAWQKTQASQGQGVQPQASKPTLPNIQGKATSPVSRQIKNMEDLMKVREQVLSEGRQSQ
jgi:hypothetical protein